MSYKWTIMAGANPDPAKGGLAAILFGLDD